MTRMALSALKRRSSLCLAALCYGFAAWNYSVHRANARFVRETSLRVVAEARAERRREQILALRDFLRRTVTNGGLPKEGRPFLRASAAETLRTGRGYCGEVTRAFICMAHELGIPAQRVNLTGAVYHVVAEAELAPGREVIVDAQQPPYIADLEPLDQVILRPEFDDYYTLNLRRLHVNWLVSRVRFRLGPLTYLVENPNLMKAVVWLLLGTAFAATAAARALLRWFLLKRGWAYVGPSVSRAAAR